MPPAAAAVRDAGPPFADDDADIILRSSDNVDFRAHKLFLSKASAVFKNMLSIPVSQHISSTAPVPPDETKDGLPVVTMPEDGPTLKILLGFCYPARLPDLSQPADLRRALAVSHKFDIEGILNVTRPFTIFLLNKGSWHPEQVFAVAWQFRMKNVVVQAARKSLEHPMFSAPSHEELDGIPASAVYILGSYRRQCVSAVTGSPTWIKHKDVDPNVVTLTQSTLACKQGCICVETIPIPHIPEMIEKWELASVPRWFSGYLAQALAKLQDLPCESTVTAHSVIAPAIQGASQCPVCKTTVAGALERFSKRFAQVIKSRVANVKLETPF